MVGELESLAAELRRSMSGETWFGPSVSVLLGDVDFSSASRVAAGEPHSIAQIVFHMAVWARYAAYRFSGGEPRELDEANWPETSEVDDAAWTAAREGLLGAYERAACALLAMAPEQLDAVDDSTPVDADGVPVTLRRVAAGLAQHGAYHAGQIAVIKRLTMTGDTSA